MPALINHERALGFHDDNAMLVEAGRLNPYDTDIGARLGFAFFEDFALRIDRVSFEYRVFEA